MLILSEQIISYALSYYRINICEINVNFEHNTDQCKDHLLCTGHNMQRYKIDDTINEIYHS